VSTPSAPPPADPPPPTGVPLATDPPVPDVPYGGAVTPVDPATVSAPLTTQSVAKGVGQAALNMTIRTVIFFVLRAIFKAIFKR
jgi:hypothetical protein